MNLKLKRHYWRAKMLHSLMLMALLGSLTSILYAQPNSTAVDNIIPPSPEATELGKYAIIPISLYTGTPEIKIPLCDVKESDLTVPVSIQYHAAGNKVDEIASRVGLGWVLNAGGVITRTVIGNPDEYGSFGFLSLTKSFTPQEAAAEGLSDEQQFDRWRRVTRKCWDFEPDQFTFNFNGYTGKFGFEWNSDGDNSILIGSESKLKMEPLGMPAYTDNNYIQGWKVTDENGVIYLFNAIEKTRYTPIEDEEDDPNNVFDNCFERASTPTSWYLSEIISPNGNWIRFIYTDYKLSYTLLVSETQRPIVTSDNPELFKKKMALLSIDGKYLSKIITSSAHTEVNFNEDSENIRTDLPLTLLFSNSLRSLKEITVKNIRSETVKHFRLNYTYETGRLTLKSLYDAPIGLVDGKPPYRFTYNQTMLPPYQKVSLPGLPSYNYLGSYQQDHWGFYNNNTATTLIPTYTYTGLFDGKEYTYQAGDRSPSTERMKAGILTDIIYPTGGSTNFEFEPHTYSAIGNTENGNEDQLAGGLRIKKISNLDALATPNVRQFQYKTDEGKSSGVISVFPNYSFWTIIFVPWPTTGEIIPLPANLHTSNSLIPIALTKDSHIGYRKITVYYGTNLDGGKSDSYFTSFYTHNDDYLKHPTKDYFMAHALPYPLPTSYDHTRGLLTKQIDYKYENGQYIPVKQIDNVYEKLEASIQGFKAAEYLPGRYSSFPGGTAEGIFATAFYTYQLGLSKLSKTTETLFENGSTYVSEKTFLYNKSNSADRAERFNASNRFVISEIQKSSEGNLLITTSHYPFEYPDIFPYKQLKDLHILSPVIESVVSESISTSSLQKVIDAKFTRYKQFNTRILPSELLKFSSVIPATDFIHSTLREDSGPDMRYYTPETRFDRYHRNGKLQQVTLSSDATSSEEDQVTAYLWDSNGANPIAKVSNASVDDCAFIDFEGIGDREGNWIIKENSQVVSSDSHTGKYSFSGKVSSENLHIGEVIVSLWAKGTGSVTVEGIQKQVNSEWKRYEWIITSDLPRELSVVTNGNLIDGLRLCPKKARMTTFTYSPLLGVSSITDENHASIFYEYDGYGRLKIIRDSEGNIVKHYQYQYKSY